MLYRNGMAIIQINAGIASAKSLKGMFMMDVIMRNPTTINAGAVAKDGIARKTGERNRDNPNRTADTNAVSPVLPP